MDSFRTAMFPPLASLAAAGLWLVLAWRSPTLTHHFAPLIAAALWGIIARNPPGAAQPDRSERLTPESSVIRSSFVGGFAIAAATTLILLVADKLQGPGLYGNFPVPAELFLHALGGAVIGSRAWTLARNPS